MGTITSLGRSAGRWLLQAAVVALILFAAGPAMAEYVISIQPSPATALPNTTGNYFDVILTNDGEPTVAVGAFSYEFSVTNANVVFQSATTTAGTPAYVFVGSSYEGPTISTTSPGQTLGASDLSTSLSGTPLNSGDMVSLGRVYFDVGSAAPGLVSITFDVGATTLSDADMNEIPVGIASPLAIDVVPEPAVAVQTLGALVIGLAAFGYRSAKRRIRA